MKHYELAWIAKDRLETYSQGWEPDNGDVKAAVGLVHGLGEHSGRYSHVGEHLAEAGYAMLGSDLRGHGKSAGTRGHAASSEVFLDHIDKQLGAAGTRYPGRPLFLYGHSLGAILVLYYCIKRKPALAGVISSGTAFHSPLEEQTLKIGLARVLGAIVPNLCMPSGLNTQDLSCDPEVLRMYVNDPLVHNMTSMQMAKDMLEYVPWTLEHAGEFQLPLLLLHGSADQIAYPSGSEEFARRVGCDCTLKIWEGFYHEIHNEPQKEEVLDFMVNWMGSKL